MTVYRMCPWFDEVLSGMRARCLDWIGGVRTADREDTRLHGDAQKNGIVEVSEGFDSIDEGSAKQLAAFDSQPRVGNNKRDLPGIV